MSTESLVRLGTTAAITAGALRIATSFVPYTEGGAGLEALYLIVDILILFGILGIYAASSVRLGSWGFTGFVLAVVGSAVIAGPDGRIGRVEMYPAGSLLLGTGVVLLALASWRAGTSPPWVAILWMASMAAGIAGAAIGVGALWALSGVAFGVALVGAGRYASRARLFGIPATPPITGVAEIALSVRDLTRMRDFYREVLGFQLLSEACHEHGPEPDPIGEPTIVFLTIRELDTPLGRHGHPQVLVLIDFQRHVFARERFDGHEPSRSTLNHLAFEIPPESWDYHQRRLDRLGLNPRPAVFRAMSARALFFDDPERNLVELICHDSIRPS